MTLPHKVPENSWQELSLHFIPSMTKLLKYIPVVIVDILDGHHDESIDLDSSLLAAYNLLKLLFKSFSVFIPLCIDKSLCKLVIIKSNYLVSAQFGHT